MDMVKKYQRCNDIIDLIFKVHQLHAKDYDSFCTNFAGGSPEETAEKLFDFVKKNVKYVEEPEHTQIVMAPRALLQRGHGDCKHYASFINGVLDALKRKGYKGFEPIYRFSSYDWLNKDPQHVFAVMKLPSGREIWIDPVLKSFDQKKRYYYHKDRKPMALYYLHGIPGEDQIGLTKQQRQAGKAARKAENKSGKGPKGIKKILLKGALVTQRNSFLLLLKANVFRMSTKIFTKAKTSPAFKEKINTFWRNVGGNPAALWLNVQRGVNTYNKLHKKKKIAGMGNADIARHCMWGVWEHREHGPCAIGVAPAAVGIAAAIAAAAPIIAKLVSLFKKEGVPEDGMSEGVDRSGEVVEQLANEQSSGNMQSTEAVKNSMEEYGIPQAQAPVNMVQRNDGSTDLTFPAQTEVTAGSDTGAGVVRLDDPVTRGKDNAVNAGNAAVDTMTSIKNWVMNPGAVWYKRPIIIVPVAVGSLIIVPKIFNALRGSKPRRRR
jgi:hypothetical protein